MSAGMRRVVWGLVIALVAVGLFVAYERLLGAAGGGALRWVKDGVRYELFLETKKRVAVGPPLREGGRSQEAKGHCVSFAWPDVPAPSWAKGGLRGSCGIARAASSRARSPRRHGGTSPAGRLVQSCSGSGISSAEITR